MRGIMWFREDLRSCDNTALYFASKNCSDGVIGLYVINEELWRAHDTAACRVEFIYRGLEALKKQLALYHIPLLIIEVTQASFEADMLNIMHETAANGLFFNRQYEVNEARRDESLVKLFEKNNLSVHAYDDQVILKPGLVKKPNGEDYSIFTPFKRAWYKEFISRDIRLLPQPRKQHPLVIESSTIPPVPREFVSSIAPNLWPAGEAVALKRLEQFAADALFNYDKQRDFPALDGTSLLSPYLATGMISPRQCFLTALAANQNEFDTGNKGVCTWLSELIWREFYKQLLVSAPRVCMHKAFKTETNAIWWDEDKTLFSAWAEGQTGYPIIDAAMRQLISTGWMHNRLRMVVAMFFTKNCFLDWRLGEKFFMSQLIDGDLAANNGGWQWSASTGTDAAPYFRIFNPLRQSVRFDPEGTFIRQYCPELTEFDNKSIHEPYTFNPLLAANSGYPRPIIELNAKRDRVLKTFKSL